MLDVMTTMDESGSILERPANIAASATRRRDAECRQQELVGIIFACAELYGW